MDWTQALMIIGSILVPLFGCVGWIIHRQDGHYKALSSELKGHGERLAKLEGEVTSLRSMTQSLLGYLLNNKTGS